MRFEHVVRLSWLLQAKERYAGREAAQLRASRLALSGPRQQIDYYDVVVGRTVHWFM